MTPPRHSAPADVAEPPALVGRSAATLADLFCQQVADRPTAAAVTDDRHTLTFADLAARAGRLADRLRRSGVGAGDLVGLYLTPGTHIVTATWGVLLAGAAYLPLATDYPEQRVAYMIEDAHVRTVVTEPACSATLDELVPHDVHVLTLDDGTGAPVPASVGPDDLAYVIYTSGTTGRPKGVAIEHRAIANQLAWLRDELGLAPGQTIMHKTPTSFDAAQWETLAVAVGAHVVVGPPGAHRDPAALIDTITAHDVTVLQCVPTLLQALVDEDRFGRCRSLRLVCSGGEALSRRLAARFTEVLPDCALVNLYGPTECTINSSSHLVTPATLATDLHTIPIGRPVAGTTFHVLDDEQRPVAPGAVGELHIGGVQLARGYLGRDEETTGRFPTLPLGTDGAPVRVYRSGDLVSRDADGTTHFVGRTDNQVKLRGHRIELDEVRLAIENHGWVRNAAVLAQRDGRTGAHQLVACVELNPREAALMDQGNHGAHHQSKQSRVQVRAQLANLGLRTASADAQTVVLPGKQEDATARRRAFARKTYRFYEGGPTRREDILAVLGRRPRAAAPTPLAALDRVRLGAILRYFGQFHSDERILPKYAYASPGALYATQLHIELSGVAGIPAGAYYYHPVRHELVLVRTLAESAVPRLRAHFLGKRSAIESVYRNNVVEVLKMETGHMLGLLDEVLPEFGLALGRGARRAGVPDLLDADQDHTYLGSYDMVPADEGVRPDPVECYVQVHSPDIAGLAPGMYAYRDGELARMSDSVILRKHVIAINQGVYERSAFGVSLVSRAEAGSWFAYVDLGRALQRLESNDIGVGFMSSGYSSETGHDLPAATRLAAILHNAGHAPGPCYFAVGGRVSAEQIASEGMKEDSVHTAGPAEMIRRDIADILPAHMIPARVVVVDELPRSANGKVDVHALAESGVVASGRGERVMVNPRTPAEREVCAAWSKVMKTDDVSVRDDFFESGGNSLSAVVLIQEINRRTGARLPVQLIFDQPTVAGLARRVDSGSARPESRLVPLQPNGSGRPIICWPGLGGYPMNLRPLAEASGRERPFLGVQATGINLGETPYDTVAEMARHDVALILRAQPTGPYTLWGYSFGARVAFETAYQLERQGAEVDQLVLIAPGSPVLRDTPTGTTDPYRDRAFVTLLYSVFAGRTTGPELSACLAEVDDRERFVDFVARIRPALDVAAIRRIMTVVERTYSFEYTFEEMAHRNLRAPITVLKARGDDYSFVEKAMSTLTRPPAVREFDVDHYAVLRPPAVHELAAVIRRLTEPGIPQPRTEDTNMPHVNIKHFPAQISQQQQGDLVAAISNAVQEALGCDRDAISIAMEPISPDDWYRAVYQPEIEGRPHLLCKTPRY